jgi:hypothetical protein
MTEPPPYSGVFPDPAQPTTQLPAEPPPDLAGFTVPLDAAAPPPVEPLISANYNEWWRKTIAIVKSSWRMLLTLEAIGAAVNLVLTSPTTVYQQFATRDLQRATAGGDTRPDFGPLFTGLGLNLLATFTAALVSALVTLAVVRLVIGVASGRRPEIGELLGGAARRLLPLIGWQLLASLIVLLGVCACVLPALYFAAVFMVLPVVVVLERGGVVSRCFRLFNSNLGVSVSRIATVFGITVGATVAAGLIVAVLNAIVPPESSSTAAVVGIALISTLISVVIAGGLAILTGPLIVTAYADMRARVEPVSTAMMADELSRS